MVNFTLTHWFKIYVQNKKYWINDNAYCVPTLHYYNCKFLDNTSFPIFVTKRIAKKLLHKNKVRIPQCCKETVKL